jgi:hypothetical protein
VWTTEIRQCHNRNKVRYPSDLTGEERWLIERPIPKSHPAMERDR